MAGRRKHAQRSRKTYKLRRQLMYRITCADWIRIPTEHKKKGECPHDEGRISEADS